MSSLHNDKLGVKVSRPPGGQCSDIFGPPLEQDPRKRANNKGNKSSIFDDPEPPMESPQRSRKPAEDTQNNLFGEADPLPSPRPSPKPAADEKNGGKSEEKKVDEAVTNGKNGESNGVQSFTRVRQPPGGVSSKLW